jgi:hypothetical protein
MNMMNLRDNQQDVTSVQDNVDLVSKGLIDIESIQSEVDLYLKEISEEWKASIPFTCYVINENDQPCSYPIGNTLSRIDICDYGWPNVSCREVGILSKYIQATLFQL